MKSALLAVFLATSAFGAANVQTSNYQLGNTNTWVAAFNWTADTDGSVPTTKIPLANCCQGYNVATVETVPGTPAPTGGYGVAITDGAGVDVLGGSGVALSASAAQAFPASPAATPIQGTLNLVLTGNVVSGAKGVVYIFMAKPGTFNALNLGRNPSVATGYVLDANAIASGGQPYPTLASACTAANAVGATLVVSLRWTNLLTQSLSCPIQFLSGGVMTPAANQTITLSGAVTGDLTQHFNTAASGSLISFTGPTPAAYPQWWGAAGNDSTDDTVAVQSCITASSITRLTCNVPPAVYKITGVGLKMQVGQPSLTGLQSIGEANPVFSYYGTGTCLAIGDGTTRVFAINITNISCRAANGVSATNGIYARNLSGGDWQGITVGGGATTGTFTNAIHLSDAGLINIYRAVISNQSYTAGTNAILFDDFVLFGNSDIKITGGDVSGFENNYNLRSCAGCTFDGIYNENFDKAVFLDNTVALSANSGIAGVDFINCSFNTSGTGPSNRKIFQISSTTGNRITVDQLNFTSNRMFLSGGGGTTFPFLLNISSIAAGSTFQMNLDKNQIAGVGTAVVSANSVSAKIFFGQNYTVDNLGSNNRPSDLSGTATVNNIAPQSTSRIQLFSTDSNGNNTAASYTTAGTLTVGTAGTAINKYKVYSASLDFAAPGAVPGCNTALALTAAGTVTGSSPVFASPPVSESGAIKFFAWTEPNGTIAGHWCQFSGAPIDPDGAGATYSVSVIQ
jgi:hypothetical protein